MTDLDHGCETTKYLAGLSNIRKVLLAPVMSSKHMHTRTHTHTTATFRHPEGINHGGNRKNLTAYTVTRTSLPDC